MNWFKKLIPAKVLNINTGKNTGIPEGLWSKCPECNSFLFSKELEKNFHVCPKCDYHHRLTARQRLNLFLDPQNRTEIGAEVYPKDRLKFKDLKKYKDRLSAAQKTTGEKDALVCMSGELNGMPLVVCAFEFGFIGGSMGTVVGERFVQAVQMAITLQSPLVCFSCSGGVRMQESLFGLMQMAKTSAALARLSAAKLPYISVLVDPCTGGVSASLAMLGDVHIAEPKALIGFAGPRVIEQTVREVLPEGFQRSEFLLDKGFVDMIVPRQLLRDKLFSLLTNLMAGRKYY